MDNSEQKEYWDGDGGDKWARLSPLLDVMLAPFNAAILDSAAISGTAHIADIGCGTGTLTRDAASRAAAGSATGLDLSNALVKLATQAAPDGGTVPARFEAGDATIHTPRQPYTHMISRFGVMFFADPVLAFSKLRSMMASGGTLSFACWQGLLENEWACVPMLAALPLLPQAPQPPAPGTPGPFAFADKDRVHGILADAGWHNININNFTTDVTLPGTSLEEAVDFALDLGPLAALIRDQKLDPAPFRAAVSEQLAQKMGSHDRINLPAAVWIVTATA